MCFSLSKTKLKFIFPSKTVKSLTFFWNRKKIYYIISQKFCRTFDFCLDARTTKKYCQNLNRPKNRGSKCAQTYVVKYNEIDKDDWWHAGACSIVHPAKKIISHMKYEAWVKRPFFLNSFVGKLTFGRQARLWYGIWSLHFETESSGTVCKVVRIFP